MKLPKKYRGDGLHVWCTKCKKTVTNHPCEHTDKHRYQSRIYNPHTKRQDIIRSWDTKDHSEAFDQHYQFKKQLVDANFQIHQEETRQEYKPKFLLEAAQMYLDYLNDVDVPEYSKKRLSSQYLKDQAKYIQRFLSEVKRTTGRLTDFPIIAVNEQHISNFHLFIKENGWSDSSYNHHMNSVRYLFNYLIKNMGIEMINPLHGVKKKTIHYSKEIITESEFQTLLDTITETNAWGEKGKVKSKVNYYRPWTKDVFLLAILTGERLDGLVNIQWKHIKDNHLIIPNWKVNRKENSEAYESYTFITTDLAELLVKLEPSDPDQYVLVPDWENRQTLKNLITKSFTHFWRKTGIDKKVSFKNLRKTYITRVFDLIGDKAKSIKHTNDETALRHYMNEKEIVSKMQGQRMYNFTE